MNWLTAAVKATFPWPDQKVSLEYLGNTFILHPETEYDSQAVSMHCSTEMNMPTANLLLNRFLSALSWTHEGGISVLFSAGNNGPEPIKVGVTPSRFITHKFRADNLPEPKDERSLRALALYREAASEQNPAYSFLGFFKIINILANGGTQQIDWINNHLHIISQPHILKRLNELQKFHQNIGDYLYYQGRCAIAHAYDEPVVDPDLPEEIKRLSDDIAIIKELAVWAIENELGIISTKSYNAAHLYEIEGFSEMLGSAIVEDLKAGKMVSALPDIMNPLSFSVRVRNHNLLNSFENLKLVRVEQDEKQLLCLLESDGGTLHLEFALDFGQNRLLFDSLHRVKIRDNESAEAMYALNDFALFAKAQYLNGEIEIYNQNNGKLLSRTRPFIPTNIDLPATIHNLEELSRQALEKANQRKRAQHTNEN